MNKESIKRLALIAGIGAAAMVNDLRRHPHEIKTSSATKLYRKRRNRKKQLAKVSKRRNRH